MRADADLVQRISRSDIYSSTKKLSETAPNCL